MKVLKKLFEYVLIVVLASASALSYELLIFPNNFAPAGFNGIATMIQHIFGINVGYLSLLFNIPLIIAVFFLVNKEFAVKTLVYIVTFSGMLIAFKLPSVDLDRFIYQTDNGTSTILGPLAAGIIGGGILGTILLLNCCSGGTDLVAVLVHKKNPSYNFVWVGFVLNSMVAVVSYFVYDYQLEPVILCILFSYFLSAMSDKMLKGSREAIKFEVITDSPDEISKEIIEKLGHSATMVKAEGCYSHDTKSMLWCVINKDQLAELKSILAKYPGSFASISNVSSTIGRFKTKRKINSPIAE